MTRIIPGRLDYSKLMPPKALPYDEQARHHFALLPHDQQRGAIQRLAAAGHGDHTISQATGLSTEMVRRLLSEREAQP